MDKRMWALGSLVALVIFSAAEAFALTPYVPEGKSSCAHVACDKTASGNHIGAFGLTGVTDDKAAVTECTPGGFACSAHAKPGFMAGATNVVVCPIKATGSVIAGAGEIAAGPVILAGAILNDAYLLLTMPYRPTEHRN